MVVSKQRKKRLSNIKRALRSVNQRNKALKKAQAQAKRLGGGAKVNIVTDEKGKFVGFQASKKVSLPTGQAGEANRQALAQQGKTEQLPGQPLTKAEVSAREKTARVLQERRSRLAPERVTQQTNNQIPRSEVRAAPEQDPFKLSDLLRSEGRAKIPNELRDISTRLNFQAERVPLDDPLERQRLKLSAFAVSIGTGFTSAVLNPVETFIVGPVKLGGGIIKDAVTGRFETGALIRQEIEGRGVGFVGEPIGAGLAAFGGAKVISKSPVKFKTEKLEVKAIDEVPIIKQVTDTGLLFETSPAKIKGTTTIKTLGVQAGTRGKVLASVTTTPGEIAINFGKPGVSNKIPLSNLNKAIPAPITAAGTEALVSVLDLSKSDITRVRSIQTAGRALKGESGLKVKDVIFELDTLQNKASSSKIIEKFIAQEDGVVFGTATTQQLPKGFRVKPGDIDVVFPKLKVQELTPLIAELAKELKLSGEKVRVSPENPLIIESTAKKFLREKVVESKSGINQEILTGEPPAPAGGLGFEFGNLKAGQLTNVLKFGDAKAISAGEQFVRKGVASSFFRPKDFSAPPLFQEAGVLPKGARTKDIGGFIISGRGIIDIKSGKINPLEQFRASRASKAITEFERTFTQEQRLFIQEEIFARTSSDKVKIELDISPGIKKQFLIDPPDISPARLFNVKQGSFTQVSFNRERNRLTSEEIKKLERDTIFEEGVKGDNNLVNRFLTKFERESLGEVKLVKGKQINPGAKSPAPKTKSPSVNLDKVISSSVKITTSPSVSSVSSSFNRLDKSLFGSPSRSKGRSSKGKSPGGRSSKSVGKSQGKSLFSSVNKSLFGSPSTTSRSPSPRSPGSRSPGFTGRLFPGEPLGKRPFLPRKRKRTRGTKKRSTKRKVKRKTRFTPSLVGVASETFEPLTKKELEKITFTGLGVRGFAKGTKIRRRKRKEVFLV